MPRSGMGTPAVLSCCRGSRPERWTSHGAQRPVGEPGGSSPPRWIRRWWPRRTRRRRPGWRMMAGRAGRRLRSSPMSRTSSGIGRMRQPPTGRPHSSAVTTRRRRWSSPLCMVPDSMCRRPCPWSAWATSRTAPIWRRPDHHQSQGRPEGLAGGQDPADAHRRTGSTACGPAGGAGAGTAGVRAPSVVSMALSANGGLWHRDADRCPLLVQEAGDRQGNHHLGQTSDRPTLRT